MEMRHLPLEKLVQGCGRDLMEKQYDAHYRTSQIKQAAALGQWREPARRPELPQSRAFNLFMTIRFQEEDMNNAF